MEGFDDVVYSKEKDQGFFKMIMTKNLTLKEDPFYVFWSMTSVLGQDSLKSLLKR